MPDPHPPEEQPTGNGVDPESDELSKKIREEAEKLPDLQPPESIRERMKKRLKKEEEERKKKEQEDEKPPES